MPYIKLAPPLSTPHTHTPIDSLIKPTSKTNICFTGGRKGLRGPEAEQLLVYLCFKGRCQSKKWNWERSADRMNSTEGRLHAAFPGSNVKGIPTNVPSELRGGDVHHWEHLLHEQMNPTHVGGLLTNSSLQTG